jgi:ATP-dependent DNA helicase DinG
MINNTIPKKFQNFSNLCQQESQFVYSYRDKKKGQFELYSYPIEIAKTLTNIWSKQAVFFIGSYLEKDKNAPIFRSSLGINSDEITYLKFSTDSENQLLKLYLPSHLPLPNTPEFTQESIKEILALISAIYHNNQAIIILINDLPLKSQIAVNIAAQFGSKVQVEPENINTLTNNNILICDWQFWQKNQFDLPLPQLIIIPTLPIPSLENPLVAAKVAYYKSKRENWFHSYLLPTAIKQMQTALISIRKGEGVVALLDNRINYRSYGTNILESLEPFAKINYFDLTWFS